MDLAGCGNASIAPVRSRRIFKPGTFSEEPATIGAPEPFITGCEVWSGCVEGSCYGTHSFKTPVYIIYVNDKIFATWFTIIFISFMNKTIDPRRFHDIR